MLKNYIARENKICIFGYGAIDIGVSSTFIIFHEIKPPQGAGTRIWNKDGTKVGNWEHTGKKITLHIESLSEVTMLVNLITAIEESRGNSFTFKGVTFDFTKYEQASINVVKTAINDLRLNMLMLIAC